MELLRITMGNKVVPEKNLKRSVELKKGAGNVALVPQAAGHYDVPRVLKRPKNIVDVDYSAYGNVGDNLIENSA